jgi:hypothetical protein
MEAAIRKVKEDLQKLKAACHTKAVWIEETSTCYEVPYYFGELEKMINVTFVDRPGKQFLNEVTNYTAIIISDDQVNLNLKFFNKERVDRSDSLRVSLKFNRFQRKISTDSAEVNLKV